MSPTAAETSPAQELQPVEGARRSGLRQIIDSLICLAVAVVLFRTFLVEGYMISTGSMAPALLGYHKRVVCPKCAHEFAYGVAYDSDSGRVVDGSQPGETPAPDVVSCPNCGQRAIDIARVPPNQGDQLLVHKDVYAFQSPQRWEVVVFRNPYELTQAYVKRVVGLPGETVRIDGGEIYVNGELARKGLDDQRAMRVLVYDHDHEPRNDGGWESRWATPSAEPQWRRDGQAFVLDSSGADQEMQWLTYRHWIRSGGLHETAVPVPADLQVAVPFSALPVKYDPESRLLSCMGVLSDGERDRLLSLSDDPRFQRAVERLYRESHFSPVLDDYGYNHWHGGTPKAAVRDLMISAEVTIGNGEGKFAVQMTDGGKIYELVIDARAREMRLGLAHDAKPVHTTRLPDDFLGRQVLVEMSLFDQQVLVALDGQPVFRPWRIEAPDQSVPAPRKPVRLGAAGFAVRVDHLRLFRDVYYTQTEEQSEYELADGEYYVLGDNSPVSHDSRRWPHPAVHERLFLGKPFVVHLPSRQARITIGSTTRHIRIPDLPRIRYIR